MLIAVHLRVEGYRGAYRRMLDAKNRVAETAAAERRALEDVDDRRRSATEALNAAGICADEADRVLTGIDRDTALAPPF